MKTASDVLQFLLENAKSPLANQFLRWKVWKSWPDIVGTTIAEHSVPVSYDRGTLYVWVKSSSWMQQLVFFVKPIQEKVNAHVGKHWAKRVRFTLDKKSVPGLEEESSKEFKDFVDKHSR